VDTTEDGLSQDEAQPRDCVHQTVELCMMFKIACNEAQNQAMQRWARGTFKLMVGLGRGVSNSICQKLMIVDLVAQSRRRIERARRKWEERVEGRIVMADEEGDGQDEREGGGNLRWVPEELVMVANMMNRAMCKRCKQERLTVRHLEEVHSVKCTRFDIEEDLDKLMAIRQEKWEEVSVINKEMVDELKTRYVDVYTTLSEDK